MGGRCAYAAPPVESTDIGLPSEDTGIHVVSSSTANCVPMIPLMAFGLGIATRPDRNKSAKHLQKCGSVSRLDL